MYCPNCGAELQNGASFCTYCGTKVAESSAEKEKQSQPVWQDNAHPDSELSDKSKLAAGLLGIFLGGLGVHNFYLGYTGKAVAQLVLGICCLGTVSGIWGLIEGIMILTGSIDCDAKGKKLRE